MTAFGGGELNVDTVRLKRKSMSFKLWTPESEGSHNSTQSKFSSKKYLFLNYS